MPINAPYSAWLAENTYKLILLTIYPNNVSAIAVVTNSRFQLLSNQRSLLQRSAMSSSHPIPKDRSLQKALANKIVDEYFHSSESWLRAILRMCIFSMTWVDRYPALVIECPNQAVAKRLSRKISPLQDLLKHIIGDRPSSKRVLICAFEADRQSWRCFDTKTNSWRCWEDLQKRTASGGDGGKGKRI